MRQSHAEAMWVESQCLSVEVHAAGVKGRESHATEEAEKPHGGTESGNHTQEGKERKPRGKRKLREACDRDEKLRTGRPHGGWASNVELTCQT